MKNAFLLFPILLLACQFQSIAQQNEPVRKNKPNIHDMSRHRPNGMERKINTNNGLLRNSDSNNPQPISDLTEFRELPYWDPNISYYEVTPIALSNGDIIFIWASWDGVGFTADDSLYCATSTDGGLTWGDRKIIAHLPFNTIYYLTGLQTNSGRIIAVWTDASNGITKLISSDDNGASWGSVSSLPASSNYTWYPSVSQSINNTIYLSYSKDISGYSNIVFRTSTDDGLTWGTEKTLSNTQVTQNMGSIIPDTGTGLLAVYSRWKDGSWGIVKRTSSDEGNSWSPETILLDSPINDDNTRLIRINKDTLYLVYLTWRNGGTYEDFYYIISGDNGNTWSNPVQFTRYAGYDGYVTNLSLYNNKPFLAFISARWQTVYNTPHIWYGIIGETADDNPPPAVNYSPAYQYYFAPDKEETILGNIKDESGLQNAQVNISLNGSIEYSLPLFDDGEHNDWGAGDGIYGVTVSPFSLGDHLDYNFSVTDINNNAINVQGFTVDVVHHNSPTNPNGGFEETRVGSSSEINGWSLYRSSPTSALFEVVGDTIKEGYRALRIELTNLGTNPWDIQTVNEPFPVDQESQYRLLIWAKADKDNVFASFTVEDPSFNIWNQLFQVNLTTKWQEYSFDFFTPSGVSAGRSAIHFGGSGNSPSLPIKFYIDDLRIVKLGSTVDVENNSAAIPSEFSLSQNYPNPFNPITVINYQLAVGSQVTIKIYDVLGNEIATLVNEEKPAGTYEVNWIAKGLSSGTYFYKLQAGEFVQTKKLVLLK